MKVNTIIAIMASGCMVGCSAVNQSIKHPDQSTRLAAGFEITPSSKADLIHAETAEQYYQIGRKYQKEAQYVMAITAYHKSLKVDEGYINSIIGLATVFAEQELFHLSIPLFNQVVKMEANASNYNNLGYVYYLNKEYKQSLTALNQAVFYDANYQHAQSNLALLKRKMPNAIKPSSALPEINGITAQPVLPLPAFIAAGGTTGKAMQSNKSEPGLKQLADGRYSLTFNRAVRSKQVQTPAKPTQHIKVAVSGGISFKLQPAIKSMFDIGNKMLALFTPSNHKKHIEVINGNGLKGIAGAVAKQLKEGGAENLRVRDAKRFNKYKTYIQYRAAYRVDAMNLNSSLLNRPTIVENNNLPKDVMLRLILGRDLIG